MIKTKLLKGLFIFISISFLIFLIYNSKFLLDKVLSENILNSLKIVKNASEYIDKIKKNEDKLKNVNYKIQKIASGIDIYESTIYKEKILGVNTNKPLNLKKFFAPFVAYENNGQKPVAYSDVYKDDLIFVSGEGKFYRVTSLSKFDKKIHFKSIKSNLDKILKYNSIYLEGWFSVKDLLVHNDKIYISLNHEIKKNCFNTSILAANFDTDNLKFEFFFNPKECLKVDNNGIKYGAPKDAEKNLKKIKDTKYIESNAHQSGGKMTIYNDNILLSVGDYRYRELAQNDDTFFGKILKISLKNNDNIEIFSKGHRNPQGLIYYNQKKIISTEHGPKGGDEINFIIKDKNYGWPISSYGEHYDGVFRESAPLKKSHEEFGFQEPAKYFVPSIGISDLVKIEKKFYDNGKENLFVSSLKYKTLYFYELNNELSSIKKIYSFPVGERIRDLTYIEKSNLYVMILEDSPSIGILFFD